MPSGKKMKYAIGSVAVICCLLVIGIWWHKHKIDAISTNIAPNTDQASATSSDVSNSIASATGDNDMTAATSNAAVGTQKTSDSTSKSGGMKVQKNNYPLGSSSGSIIVNGTTRTYTIYMPAASSSAAAYLPLVVMLHGGYGTGAQAEKAYGWDKIADQYHVAILYPDGEDYAWNAGGCCGTPSAKNVDDVGFIKTLINAVGQNAPIDKKRIYATGISNGGMMSYRLACELPDTFAAIGPDAASMTVSCTDPAPQPIAIMHIQGLADQDVPFNGGFGTKGTAKVDYPSIPSVIAFWDKVDGCSASTTSKSGSVTTSTSACASGRAVTLITVDGAGHQWPGSTPVSPYIAALIGVDPPSDALNATQVLWNFFRQYSL